MGIERCQGDPFAMSQLNKESVVNRDAGSGCAHEGALPQALDWNRADAQPHCPAQAGDRFVDLENPFSACHPEHVRELGFPQGGCTAMTGNLQEPAGFLGKRHRAEQVIGDDIGIHYPFLP